MRSWVIVAAAGVLLAGCGKDGKTGNPGGPTRTFTVTVEAHEGVLFLGETYTFAMNARGSDGSTVTSGGTWGSDAPSVATVEATSGRVQIVGIGEATIFVDYQGSRGTKRISSTVNYGGRLDGRFRVTGCSQSGVFATANLCGEAATGTVFRFDGTFTQNQLTVVAEMDLGDLPADPVTAAIDAHGVLRFTSEHREGAAQATTEWVLRPSGLRQIEGTLVFRGRIVGASGTFELRGDILPSSVARSLDADGGSGSRRTLGDVLRRVHRPTQGQDATRTH